MVIGGCPYKENQKGGASETGLSTTPSQVSTIDSRVTTLESSSSSGVDFRTYIWKKAYDEPKNLYYIFQRLQFSGAKANYLLQLNPESDPYSVTPMFFIGCKNNSNTHFGWGWIAITGEVYPLVKITFSNYQLTFYYIKYSNILMDTLSINESDNVLYDYYNPVNNDEYPQ